MVAMQEDHTARYDVFQADEVRAVAALELAWTEGRLPRLQRR
jgi:hypothetical protein